MVKGNVRFYVLCWLSDKERLSFALAADTTRKQSKEYGDPSLRSDDVLCDARCDCL